MAEPVEVVVSMGEQGNRQHEVIAECGRLADGWGEAVGRAEAAEAALREAEEALTHDGPEGPGQRMFDALTILKRARTTTTEEVPHA
jgi:hypothetical protein